ncbi:MAG: GH1 family beta-glucosidase [Verrucomicrobiota bacterium]
MNNSSKHSQDGAWDRRAFLGGAAGGLAALMSTSCASLPGGGEPKASGHGGAGAGTFPKDFVWGVATAAYQLEGAAFEDGRKAATWDTFSRIPGKVVNGDTGEVACDHYHRYEEDVRLIADLGVKHYRLSVAWPRIIPDGRGAVNAKGLDFYKRLLDCLQKHGITPHITLFHWDTPQALEDRYGAWRSREIATDFAEYCSVVTKNLGDRVQYWMTINEIFCFTYLGYGVKTMPKFAPGVVLNTRKELANLVHHANLAHGLACQAIRAASPVKPHVSIVINYDAYIPAVETPENIEATKRAFVGEEHNGTVLVPILTGSYGKRIMEKLGPEAPDIREGDMKTICQPLDALGFNIYTGSYVRAASNPDGYELLPLPKAYPQMHVPWLNFLPESLYWGVRMLTDALGKAELPIFITENGCPTDDELTKTGEVLDLARVMYTRAYLKNAHRAIQEGYPLKGYFHWSLMDNFEWADGYSRRFGLVYVDYPTQKRIPKLGYHWYKQVVQQNRIV